MRMTPRPPHDPGHPMNTSTIRDEHAAALDELNERARARADREHRATEAEKDQRRRQVEDTLGPLFDALDDAHGPEPTDDGETPATFAADLEQAMRDHQADN